MWKKMKRNESVEKKWKEMRVLRLGDRLYYGYNWINCEIDDN